MIFKFEKTRLLNVVLGRGQRAIEPAVVEEVALATVEASVNSSKAIVSGLSIVRAMNIPSA